jgi:chloramphenicol O-acetyltransferase
MIATFGIVIWPFIALGNFVSASLRMCMPFGLQLAHAIQDVNHSRNESKNSRNRYNENQRQKTEL